MIPLNSQLPEKQSLRDDGVLDVHSVFLTIQGEGPFSGTPAVFVRLAGCDLACRYCDTGYTEGRRLMAQPELFVLINKFVYDSGSKPRMIVLTGGEPFRQNIGPFVRAARQFYGDTLPVQIETNGTLGLDDFPYIAATIVCSPKAPRIAKELVPWIKHLKYVLTAGETDLDGLPTSVLGNGLRPARPWPGFVHVGTVWVQPADQGDPVLNKANQHLAVLVCMTHGHRLCLQTHKLLGLE